MGLGGLSWGSRTAKAVANAGHGLYYGGTGAIRLDFLAETADVRAQHLRVNGVIGPPNLGEDLLEGDDFAGEAA